MRRSVLLLGNHPPPFGGVPTHIEYLSTYLATNGWDVHVVSLTGPRAPPVRQHGYTVHRPSRAERRRFLAPGSIGAAGRLMRRTATSGKLPLGAPRLFVGGLALAEWCRAIIQRHDIRLISAYHLFSAGLVGSWLSRDLGLPLATTIFGEIYENPDLHLRRIREVRQIAAQSRALLSCSEHCARSLRLLGLLDQVETVYYGIDTSRFSPGRDATPLLRRLDLPPDRPIVLYLARMNRIMGLEVLLQAMPAVLAEHPDAFFLLAGGQGELTARAHEAALRWPRHVKVATDVPGDDLPLCYAAASAVVVPSINARACLGLAIAEALASGKPVVVSNVGGGPEIVQQDRHGVLVPPDDPAALAGGVNSLLRDRARRERLAAAGRQRVLQHFDKDATNRAMESHFLDLLR